MGITEKVHDGLVSDSVRQCVGIARQRIEQGAYVLAGYWAGRAAEQVSRIIDPSTRVELRIEVEAVEAEAVAAEHESNLRQKKRTA